ncbi:anthrax toxin lethal factor-related metalloendopeptidase [Aliivibrio fischeri]|uniref:Peptidase n=1 Tax=Aliivibrio fischeri TaxID=668 RepID=A0A510UMP2_ALIFS|nr:peptidase [Aliivibrio fischeri]MUK51200.1 peptidase [Aliivibrio fischeri]GEK15849.1 hypothetical protein AFI02nite_38850 [Aliivibrio fischeri]
MRYKSLPSVSAEEKQETKDEIAKRQRQERRAELNYTETDYARWTANRKRVEAGREINEILESLDLDVNIDTIFGLKENLYPMLGGTKYRPYINRLLEETNPHFAKDGPLTLSDMQWLKSYIDSKAIDRFKKSLGHVKPHKASGVSEFDAKYLVSKELMKTECVFLSHGISSEIKVVVTKDNVTTYWAHLDGVSVRGHPEGSTWNSIPGAGAPDGETELVIAIRQNKDGKWELPSGNHGSSNLVLHEFGHALDKVIGNKMDKNLFSQSPEFYRNWYYEFKAGNLKDLYYTQSENNYETGLEETFAEGFAKYYGSNGNSAAVTQYDWPWVTSYFYQTLLPKLKNEL